MSDEQFDLEAAKNFDEDTLGNIFDTYAPILYRYALRLTGDPQESDQIVGDVFARLLEKFAEGKGPSSNLRSYLFQIAYHTVVDNARERQRTVPIDIAENFLAEEDGLSGTVEERIRLDQVQRAIDDELTDEQRHVILLRYQEEFSLQETATITGKNVNAVKALQNRGVSKLRQVLDVIVQSGSRQ